jgi:hypothetical protein
MTIFLRRASLRLVNQSSIPTLIKHVQKGDPDGDGHGTSQAQLSANNAHAILSNVSRHCPALHKPHVAELVKAIADERNLRLVNMSLHALSSLAQWNKTLTPTDKSVGIFFASRFINDLALDDSGKELHALSLNLGTAGPNTLLDLCVVSKIKTVYVRKLLTYVYSRFKFEDS